MIHFALAVALTLAAGKTTNAEKNTPARSPPADAVAIKKASAVDKPAEASADAGTGPAPAPADKPAGPDVSTMTFSPENVKAIVAFYQPQIQTCYEQTLATKDKAVEGVLKTKWLIGPQGLVTKAQIVKKGTTLNDPKLHDCVVTVLSSMSFPKPPNGKNQPIEFPFNLKAVH